MKYPKYPFPSPQPDDKNIAMRQRPKRLANRNAPILEMTYSRTEILNLTVH